MCLGLGPFRVSKGSNIIMFFSNSRQSKEDGGTNRLKSDEFNEVELIRMNISKVKVIDLWPHGLKGNFSDFS